MKVRAANLLDLGRIEDIYQATLRPQAAQPPPVRLWALVSHTLSALLPIYQESLLFVAEEDGRLCGFVQATGLGPALGLPRNARALQVLNLAAAEGVDTDEVVAALVEQLAARALGAGVLRLLVRLPLDDEMTPTIRRQGFRQYATETVLFADFPRARGGSTAGLRPARGRDATMLYQLYRKVTPQGVSMVEAPSYRDWKMVRDVHGGQQHVVDRVDLVAWSHVARSAEPALPHSMSFMVLPEQDLAGDVADHAIGLTGGGAAWSSLRHYDSHIIESLRARGFSSLLTQALLVKELALQVPVREKGLVPSFG